jgi:hypothetical protein
MKLIKTSGIFGILLLCSCKMDGSFEKIGDGYQLYYSHKTVDLINSTNQLVIQDIWGYSKSDSFILAYRKIIDSKMSDIDEDKIWKKSHPYDTIQYWIVKKIKIDIDTTYGPLSNREFINLRSELKVNPSMVLQIDKDSVSRN